MLAVRGWMRCEVIRYLLNLYVDETCVHDHDVDQEHRRQRAVGRTGGRGLII